MQTTVEKSFGGSLIERVNLNYLLDRKSSQIDGDGALPITNTLEARLIARDSLSREGIVVPHEFSESKVFDPESVDRGWDMYWALEMAAARMKIGSTGGDYTIYLPGRFLHYDLMAHNISSLFNGNGRKGINGKKVLEAGCGSGLVPDMLVNRGAIATGIDRSVMAVQFARYLANHLKVGGKVQFNQGDYFDLQFGNGEFDVVFNAGVFEHLNEQEANTLLREMTRVTKPGGYVFVSIPNEASPFYKRFKEEERRTKSKFPSLVKIPVEHVRYRHDLSTLMEAASLQVVREDGILIAPSSPIKEGDINERDIGIFDRYLPKQTSAPNVESRVATWRGFELIVDNGLRMRYGWSGYYVGQNVGQKKAA